MNSMSRGFHNPCKKEECPKVFCREEEKERERERECPTIVKCGCPSSTTIPAVTGVGTTFTLASLTLDTSCICDPNIKIDFTANMVAPVPFTGNINIQIFKICRCDNVAHPVGPVWNFHQIAELSSETFSFFICDSDSCDNDCCTYTAVATVALATIGSLSINNATLAATVSCKNSCHRCRRDHDDCHRCRRDCDKF